MEDSGNFQGSALEDILWGGFHEGWVSMMPALCMMVVQMNVTWGVMQGLDLTGSCRTLASRPTLGLHTGDWGRF